MSSISPCEGDGPGANPGFLTISETKRRGPQSNCYPVGRAVQAAVCKTAEAGAIPARDSIADEACRLILIGAMCMFIPL